MIAINSRTAEVQPGVGQSHDGFLALQPIIERHAKFIFRHLSAANCEEAVAEAVAAAFVSYLSLRARGKDPLQFSGMMAVRAIQSVKNGRHVGGHVHVRDAFSRAAQRRGQYQLQGLPEPHQPWAEALVDNRQTPILDQVWFRCDFPRWLRSLRPRDRRLAGLLALGHSTKAMARRFRISTARISQLRREFYDEWQRFHGEAA